MRDSACGSERSLRGWGCMLDCKIPDFLYRCAGPV